MTAPPGSPPMKPSICPARRAAAAEPELPTAIAATSRSGCGPARPALRAHKEAVDRPRAGGGGGRARAAHRDDRYVTVGLEARVPQHGAEGKVGGAARAGH